MARPRKLKDFEWFKCDALNWAVFLYALRDGLPGIYEIAEWEPIPEFRGAYRMTRVIEARIINTSAAGKFRPPPTPRSLVIRPVTPAREIWEQFKQARSEAAIRGAIRAVHAWAQTSGMLHSVESGLLSKKSAGQTKNDPRFEFLASHAQDLLKARQLWNYPRTDRRLSDDKRINFFAKVFAGLEAGIAPATATRRLSRVYFAREFEKQRRQQLVELWKKHWKKSVEEGEKQ